MVLDLVDAVAVAIEGAQLGRVLVGLHAPGDRFAAGEPADAVQPLDCPVCAFTANGVGERVVGAEEVVVDERRGLVEDLVRARHALDGK